MASGLETTRHEWAEGHRRLQASPDRALLDEVDTMLEQLRRRVGQTFTLDQLADAYSDADRWALAALEDEGRPGWPVRLSTALDAAFHLYSRGAVDYRP